MDRGVSTVLDVGIVCLLITAGAVLLVSVPDGPTEVPDADRTGRALLPATVTLQHDGHTVQTAVSDVLVLAVTNGSLSADARAQIRNTTESITPTAQVGAKALDGGPAITIGPTPPPGADVDAAVFRLGGNERGEGVVLTVRTWSR